jgi:hypothetical protein
MGSKIKASTLKSLTTVKEKKARAALASLPWGCHRAPPACHNPHRLFWLDGEVRSCLALSAEKTTVLRAHRPNNQN